MTQLAERSACSPGAMIIDVIEDAIFKRHVGLAPRAVIFSIGDSRGLVAGGIGAGLSTPGLKIPKLGSIVARQIVGRALNAAGATTGMWNEGWIFKTASIGNRELVRSDFMGGCILAEAGVSTPIKGRTGTVFLVGLDPAQLGDLISPGAMIVDVIEDAIFKRPVGLAPKAVIFSIGDSRGLVAGGAAYVGFMG